jgi:hypothetical protein
MPEDSASERRTSDKILWHRDRMEPDPTEIRLFKNDDYPFRKAEHIYGNI